MSLIENHPRRFEIEGILAKDLSYRQKAELIKKEVGVSVSHKTLQVYHTTKMNGEITTNNADADAETDGETSGTPVKIDQKELEDIALRIKRAGGKGYALNVLRDELSELLAMQILLTKDALKRHTNGEIRYPSEHVRNLQIFANMIGK